MELGLAGLTRSSEGGARDSDTHTLPCKTGVLVPVGPNSGASGGSVVKSLPTMQGGLC